MAGWQEKPPYYSDGDIPGIADWQWRQFTVMGRMTGLGAHDRTSPDPLARKRWLFPVILLGGIFWAAVTVAAFSTGML